MNDDDDGDATVFQTEEDREKLIRDLPSEQHDFDSEDDTTTMGF